MSRFSRLDMVLATRSVTSLWNTYKMDSTKKATEAILLVPCTEPKIREMSPLLLLNAYSVSLASLSLDDLRKILRTAGMKAALCEYEQL